MDIEVMCIATSLYKTLAERVRGRPPAPAAAGICAALYG